MTFNQFEEVVNNHIAKTGNFILHVLMNPYTLNSLMRDAYLREAIAYPHTPSKADAVIMNVPVFINTQVPNDVAYPMYGEEPKTLAPYIAYEGNK